MTKLKKITEGQIEAAFIEILQNGRIPSSEEIADILHMSRSGFYLRLEELGIDTMENLFVKMYAERLGTVINDDTGSVFELIKQWKQDSEELKKVKEQLDIAYEALFTIANYLEDDVTQREETLMSIAYEAYERIDEIREEENFDD